MKPAKGLKVKDITLGSGPPANVGDEVLVEFECHLNRGDLLFSSKENGACKLRIGQRNTVIGNRSQGRKKGRRGILRKGSADSLD